MRESHVAPQRMWIPRTSRSSVLCASSSALLAPTRKTIGAEPMPVLPAHPHAERGHGTSRPLPLQSHCSPARTYTPGESRCCSAQPSASGAEGRSHRKTRGTHRARRLSLHTPYPARPFLRRSFALAFAGKSRMRTLSRSALDSPTGAATGTGERVSEAAWTDSVMMEGLGR
jgi:hypothetical protein